jgi:Protein of unknown function (DUF616)
MSEITVLTSITAGKDHLRDDQCTGGATFIAYVSEEYHSEVWEQRPAYDRFRSARRNSRAPKILSHQFCETDCSIWLDGNLALRVNPVRLVETWLGEYDFAVFRHPERNCIYEEALNCIGYGADDPELIKRQVSKYANEGFPKNFGLAEANVIVRRHSRDVIEFNKAWWSEYCIHCVRDQLSFMYTVKKTGLRINWITPSVFTGNTHFHGLAHFDAAARAA